MPATAFTVDPSLATSATNYHTISAAVAAASGPTVITVAPGTYNETVSIDRDDITLVSSGGRAATIINGSDASPHLGTIEIAPGADNVRVEGFTIQGINGNGASEKAAVYIVGPSDNIQIVDNEIEARGDSGLTATFGAAITNVVIDGNEFSGKTFVGTNPESSASNTFSGQFDLGNDYPRQLVVMGNGGGTGNPTSTNNITFTNNLLSGTAGGISSVTGLPFGNNLVTIDATQTEISGNTFTGFTGAFTPALRTRRPDTSIDDNTFDQSGGGQFAFPNSVLVQNNASESLLDNSFVNSEGIHVFAGGPGAEALTGTPGDDLFYASAGNDTLDGAGGSDTIDMTAAGSSGSFVDLGSGLAFSTATGIDNISNFENVTGSSGADGLYGSTGDNTFTATAGADVIDGRGGVDTFDAGAATAAVTADLGTGAVSGAHTATLTSVENIVTGSGNDSVTGSTGANDIATGGGADRVVTGGGSDTVDGGADADTVVFSGDVADYVVTWDGTTAIVTGNGDAVTVTVTNAGTLEFADGNVLLVSTTSDEFGTIQSAVDAAASGDTILVAEGTYVEQVVVDGIDNLTIASAGDVTVQAPADVVETARSSSDREMHAVITVVGSDNVVIRGVTVDGDGRANTVDEGGGAGQAQYVGVFFRNSSGGLDAVDITGVRDPLPGGTTIDGFDIVSGVQRGVGLQVDNDAIMDFFMHGGSISDFQKNGTVFNRADLDIDGVTITGGGAQTINAQNGLQVLNSTGTITNSIIEHIGYAGPADAYSGAILAFGNTGLNITDNTITGSNDATTDAKVVGIFILDFGTPNSGGSITGNTISHVDTGIDVSGDITPAGILIEDNTVTDVDLSDPYAGGVSHYPNAALTTPFTVEGTAANDLLQGAAGADDLSGLGGNDTLDGKGGADTLSGGDGDDTYLADGTDTLAEAAGEGTDTVIATGDFTLAAGVEVENLTLETLASRTEDFENFSLGAISNGENGWRYYGGVKDQEVITDPDNPLNQVFRMSSDPGVGDFSGPYSPALSLSAGEPGTTADADSHAVSFDFKAVQLADFSRLEVDFGTDAATDRNNFLVIENLADGIRIAVNEPDSGGNFLPSTPYTGNRTLVSGIDAADGHTLSMVARYVDGPDNDVIDVYLDGNLIGTTTSFENFRDALGGTHADNAEANQTSSLFFRGGAGAVTDGPGGQNQGFTFDNITNAVFNSGNSLTGNEFSQTITGDAGDNELSGMGGNDTVVGGLGADTLDGGEGADVLTGGGGTDTADYTGGNLADATITFGPGTVTVTTTAQGTDTVSGVEKLVFDDANVLVVGAGGYASIQAAVDAAADGDIILVAPGTYTENVSITDGRALTIMGGDGGTVTLNGSISVGGALDGTFTIAGIDIDAGSNAYGVLVTASDGGNSAVVLDGVNISNANQNGFAYVRSGNEGAPTLTDVIDAITITGGSFTNNGDTNTGSGGRGDVLLFGFNGDLTLSDLTFSNADPDGQKAIQIRGLQDGGDVSGVGPYDPAGDLVMTNITLTGSYLQDAIAIYRIAGFASTDIADVSFNGNAPWGIFNADGVGGTLDLSDVGGTNGATGGFGFPISVSMQGLASDDVFTGGDGQDILNGRGGADELNGGGGDDLFVVTDAAHATGDSVDGGIGTDTVLFASAGGGTLVLNGGTAGIEAVTVSGGALNAVAMNIDATAVGNGLTITGNGAANSLTGSGFADDIDGGGGNDIIATNAGSDTVEGGAGTDTVVLAGNRAIWTITWDGDTATATDGTDTMTITGAGRLQFDDIDVVLVSATGEFATIQAGVDAAANGDQVLVADGTYAGATITDKAITITGAGSAVQINGTLNVSDTMGAGDEMRFENLLIDATGQSYGINVRSSANDILGVNDGSVILSGVTIENARELGFFYAHPGNGSNPTNPNTIGTISILDSTFSQNGEIYTGARGQGHVNLFGFNGNLTVQGSSFATTGTDQGDAGFRGGPVSTGGAAVNADKAITVTGIRTGTPGVGGYVDAGTLVLDDVDIDGFYGSDVISFYTIQSFASISISDVDVNAQARWALINFDSVSGVIDLSSGFTGTNTFPGAEIAELQGLATDDAITGTSGNDLLYGRGGSDTLSGGDGDDLFVITAGSEHTGTESISGGGGSGDTVLFAAASAGTLVLNAGTTGIEQVTLLPGVVALNVNANAVGNALKINGNDGANTLTGTAFADTISGGGGNDSLVGGALGDSMLGGAGADTVNGGTGDDTLEGGDGADLLNGGGQTDTASYAGSTAGVSVDLFNSTASGGDAAGDVLSSIENLIGSNHADTLTGDTGANVITGLAGNDVLDGGDASDTAVFALDWADYTITRSGSTYTLSDGVNTVTASNFETFQFADQTISVVGDPDLIVTQAPEVISILETGVDEDSDVDTIEIINTSPAGTVVAVVTADDANLPLGDSISFSLVDGLGNAYAGPYEIVATSPTTAEIRTTAAVTGDETFSVRVTDESGGFTDQSVTVGYLDPNDDPTDITFGSDPLAIDENAEGGIISTIAAVDPDAGETFTWAVDDARFEVAELAPGIFTLKLVDGESLDYETETSVDIEVTVTDSEGATYSETVTVDVNPVNEAPGGGGGLATWTPDAVQAGLRRAPLTPAPVVTDPEGDTLTYQLATAPLSGALYVGNTLVTVGMVLTAAEFATLTYAASQTPGSYGASFAVSDGVNATALNVVLGVSAAVDDTLTGTGDADSLDGGAGHDIISGLNGQDRLFGGTGHDTLSGGNGSDTISGGADADVISGDVGADQLNGNTENDSIFGGADNDTLNGGDGDDVLEGGAGADQLVGGQGIDLASYAGSEDGLVISLDNPGINTGEALGDTYNGIEGVLGGTGNDTINGRTLNDVIIGGDGDDRINGSRGNDTLTGGSGADTFVFSSTLAASNTDTITDFVSGTDLLRVARSIVTAAGTQVTVDEFVAGSAAVDGNDFFIYNQTTGMLSYDADGNGGGTAVDIANLGAGTVMVFDDLRLF